MAKELPYFKFEPSEWIAKDIQDCSLSAQGAFINICSYYWLRLGALKYATALKRHSEGSEDVMQELIECGAIKEKEGLITIDFLDDQLREFKSISSTNSENARKGWEKRKKEADSMRPHSEGKAIREEKRREEKIIEEKKEDLEIQKFSFKKSLIDLGFESELVSDWLKVRRTKKASNTETAFKAFVSEVRKTGYDINEILKFCIERDWKGFKYDWWVKIKNDETGTGKKELDHEKFLRLAKSARGEA